MTIKHLSDFFEKMEKLSVEHSSRHLVFRGHSKTSHKLEPSVFRTKKWRESEHLMFKQLLSEHPKEFEGDISTFDKLVRAQHYGLPTRLLDVSANPLVALYFACCSNNSDDGKVLVISSSKQKHRYFDSDTVSLLANLSFLRRSEKEELLSVAKQNASGKSTISERVEKYRGQANLSGLLQSVRAEKPHFEGRVDPFDLGFVLAVTPRKSHDRIRAQEGQFLLFGLVEEPTGEHLVNFKYSEIEIPAAAKSDLLRELEQVGISERTLFPEIDKTALQIKRKYS